MAGTRGRFHRSTQMERLRGIADQLQPRRTVRGEVQERSSQAVLGRVQEYATSCEENLRLVEALFDTEADKDASIQALFGEDHILEGNVRYVPTCNLYLPPHSIGLSPSELEAVARRLGSVAEELTAALRQHRRLPRPEAMKQTMDSLNKAYHTCLMAFLSPMCELKYEVGNTTIRIEFAQCASDMSRGRAAIAEALQSIGEG